MCRAAEKWKITKNACPGDVGELTDTNTEDRGIGSKQNEAVVWRYKRRQQSTDDEVDADQRYNVDTAEISNETDNDTHQRAGDANDENQRRCLSGVEADLQLTKVRQVSNRNDKRYMRQQVTESKRNEREVGQ